MRVNNISTVVRNDKERTRAYFWCGPAWLWLIIIVALECLLMSGWIAREYFFFDYTCLLLHQNRSTIISDHAAAFGPRIIYGSPDPRPKSRKLRFLEFNSTIPQFVGDIESDAPKFVEIYDSNGRLINDGSAIVMDEPMIMEADLAKFDERVSRRIKRSYDDSEANSPIPVAIRRKPVLRRRKKKPPITPLTTMESVVLIEQLPISGESGNQGKLLKIKTTRIKSFPQNSTKIIKRRRKKKPVSKMASMENQENGIEVQENRYYSREEVVGERRRLKKLADEDEEEQGRGRMLRGYKGKARNRGKPKAKETNSPVVGSDAVTPLPTLPTTAITTSPSSNINIAVTQLPANSTTSIVMAEVVMKAVNDAFHSDKDDKDKDKENEETTTTSTIATTTIPSLITAGTTAPTITFAGYSQDYKGEEEVIIDSSQHPRAIPEQPKIYPDSNNLQPKENNFQIQIETFSTLALCIARSLFDFWCFAQLIASIPFLFGICLRIRCLFIARLMLDALFLVILFIYTITIIAFSIILYILVDEMTTEVVIEWLIFGILLLFAMIVYVFTFTITLRCCELVLNERIKPYKEKRSKSLLYTEIASDQMLEVADDV